MKNLGKRISIFIVVILISFMSFNNICIHANEISERKVEYMQEYDGFYLENITVEEVLQAFNKSKELKLIETNNKQEVSNNFTEIAKKALDSKRLSNSKNTTGTYREDYVLTMYITGVNGESVAVHNTCNMEMKTLKINNKNYAQFVKIYLGPTYWLDSSNYTFSTTGTSSPKGSILNGGATLKVEQIIQLETVKAYSSNTGATFGWFSFGSSIGGNYYKRNSSKTYSSVYNLPLINIVM